MGRCLLDMVAHYDPTPSKTVAESQQQSKNMTMFSAEDLLTLVKYVYQEAGDSLSGMRIAVMNVLERNDLEGMETFAKSPMRYGNVEVRKKMRIDMSHIVYSYRDTIIKHLEMAENKDFVEQLTKLKDVALYTCDHKKKVHFPKLFWETMRVIANNLETDETFTPIMPEKKPVPASSFVVGETVYVDNCGREWGRGKVVSINLDIKDMDKYQISVNHSDKNKDTKYIVVALDNIEGSDSTSNLGFFPEFMVRYTPWPKFG